MVKTQQALFGAVATAAYCIGGVAAWGAEGHQAVGYIAQEFLTTKALAFVEKSLGSTYNKSLGVAATWADQVKYYSEYRFSAPYHFLDAEDSPLSGSCSVDEARDCGSEGCITAALTNYTQRVNDTSLSAAQRQEALKFIDHFVGDIAQPLHVEAYQVGGNDIPATCGDDSDTELHAVWDTGIIQTQLNATYDGSVTDWADALVTAIKSGKYESAKKDWLNCTDPTKTSSTLERRGVSPSLNLRADILGVMQRRDSSAVLACPLEWAKETNAYDCSYVFKYTNGTDLCAGSYYKGAVPIIEEQIAKHGYRLAAWLNVIFDGETGLDGPSDVAARGVGEL